MSQFPRDYEVEVLPGLPGTGEIRAFAPHGASTHAEGYVIRLTTKSGTTWIGNFKRGDGRLSTWAATPSPARVLVIAGGTGYLVAVGDPASYSVLPGQPIRFVAPVVAAGLLVMADYTEVMASDSTGVRWVSDRVAWDELVIDRLDDRTIQGHGFDPASGRMMSFVLDTRSGRLVEGHAVIT